MAGIDKQLANANVVVAVLIGGASGFVGGRLDLVVQRFVDRGLQPDMFGDAVRDLLDPRLRDSGGRLGADAPRSVQKNIKERAL